jgi:hypothetical protein
VTTRSRMIMRSAFKPDFVTDATRVLRLRNTCRQNRSGPPKDVANLVADAYQHAHCLTLFGRRGEIVELTAPPERGFFYRVVARAA